jgi:hypothetical protein
MKNFLLFASISVAAGILFTNIYNSLVDAKCWGANMPQSIDIARQYFKVANPGNFYRLISPVNQVLALLALIVFWKSAPAARPYLGTALVLYVLGDVFTFAYFYPRNNVMFSSPITAIDVITKAWKEWSSMNWLRSAIVIAGLVFSFMAVHKVYTGK